MSRIILLSFSVMKKKKSGKIGTINLFKQKFRVFIHGDRF